MKKITTLLAALVSFSVFADVNGDLGNFFNNLGFDGNATKAQAWQGQAAGYVTGGSVYLRNQVKNVQLMSVELPSINAGCGGIDAYLGSFSFISGEQITRFGKQIMSNAAGYAFDLALQTMVPEMKQAKDFLQKMANEINGMNMSSCQAAQGIIGGLFPKTQVSQQKVCQDIAGENNIFADWAASRQGCTVGGKMDEVQNKANAKEKDQILKNKNLIWDTLSANHLFDDNRELKEFVMSIVGSIVFDDKGNLTSLTPLVDNRDVVKSLMNGGSAKVYGCDSADLCLHPTVHTVNINENKALTNLVKELLLGIGAKLQTDEGLTEKEKGFINSTSVPILKYLTTAQSMGMDGSYLLEMSDFIAQNIMMQYLDELVKQANLALAAKNYPEAASNELRGNIVTASRLLAQMKLDSATAQSALNALEQNMAYLQQQVSTNLLTNYQSNYQFGAQ